MSLLSWLLSFRLKASDAFVDADDQIYLLRVPDGTSKRTMRDLVNELEDKFDAHFIAVRDGINIEDVTDIIVEKYADWKREERERERAEQAERDAKDPRKRPPGGHMFG